MPNIEKKYIYKISRPDGTYLGVLPPSTIKSKFGYNQQINTAGAQLTIIVATTADTADQPSSPILDETGAVITDEVSSPILDEGAIQAVGSSDPRILISNDNNIEVIEISDYYPNGHVVYSGYISRWKANFGGDDCITVTCLNQSQDLGNHITPGSESEVLDQSQTVDNDNGTLFQDSGGVYLRAGQTFTVGPNVNNITKITVRLNANTTNQNVTLRLWNSINDFYGGGTNLGSVTQVVSGTTPTDYTFTFASPIAVTPGGNYFFSLTGGDANAYTIHWSTSSSYSGGQFYISIYTFPNVWTENSTPGQQDLYFKTYYNVLSTSKTYTNTDVTNILTDVFNYYVIDGGLVSAPPGGWALTGILTNYTFKVSTILAAIQKLKELGPADWYWYVDPATNILYYQPQGTTTDHTVVKGRHIDELDIEATKENIINDVLFTGGNDGTGSGENVFVRTKDTDSIAAGRVGLALPVDNRVDGTDGAETAAQLNQNLIDRNNEETYSTQVVIADTTYDISSYNLGDMIDFANFGTFADDLLLPVVAKNVGEDSTQLSLGVLPQRDSAQVESIKKSLLDQQTLDNPDVPS